MAFTGSNPQARVTGLKELPGRTNYIIGNDPTKWRTNVPTYGRVHYENIYPGIDLVYYGKQRHLEYDIVIAPGADPQKIALAFEGVDKIEIDPHGDLAVRTPGGTILQRRPTAFQERAGVRREIACNYVLKETGQVGLQVAAYDSNRPLVIDPVLSYSTYLGGSDSEESDGIAVDAAGNAYVTGVTGSSGFPGTAGSPIQSTFAGGDAFVTKINAAGTALVYSTYLGGSGGDGGNAIAVDAAGNAYVTGFTDTPGSGFPGTHAGSIQATNGGGFSDAFVTKINAAGTALVYSTYLGGSGDDEGDGIAVDAAGNAYVTGRTDTPGSGFPGTAGSPIQATNGGGFDAFVAKINAAGTALVYSTYLGGSGFELAQGIAVDAAENVYVTGVTDSADFPTTPGVFQPTLNGPDDVFVARISAADVVATDSATAPEPGMATASTAPTTAGQAGVSVTLTNGPGGGGAATVTVRTYSANPTAVNIFDAGGGFVDVRVTGADALDSAIARFYYPSTVTGATEASLQLLYFTGASWEPVLGTASVPPAKDMTDNQDGTVSGGRFLVTFDSTSTPQITQLTGTVFTMTDPGRLTSLGPANIWVGLKNSDDVGIRFDLRAEVYRNGTELVGSGEVSSVPGGSSGFNNAREHTIGLTAVTGVSFSSGDTVSITLLVRNACSGSGKNSGTARLWYNDAAADSRFDATIGSPATYYLLEGFTLETTPGSGPRLRIDTAAGAKCSPYKVFGTWSRTF